MASAERWAGRLRAGWHAGADPGLGLRAVAALYGGLTALRRGAYRRGWLRSQRLPVPVLVVGNFSVGGSGKTPLVIALALWLRERGWRVGVVSRGHGRRSGELREVHPGDDPAEVGDEPLLVVEATGVPVAVAARRVDAARFLVERHGCSLVLADDGLQHLALARDLEIEVIDGERGYGNGRLLPAGPMRELPGSRPPCALRVVQGGDAGAFAGAHPMRLELAGLRPLAEGLRRTLEQLAGQRVHAVAGIGNPARFFATLRGAGLDPVEHAFPDHHRFRPEDLVFEPTLPILMTAKDAVKCRGFAPSDCHVLEVEARLPPEFFEQLQRLLPAAPGAQA